MVVFFPVIVLVYSPGRRNCCSCFLRKRSQGMILVSLREAHRCSLFVQKFLRRSRTFSVVLFVYKYKISNVLLYIVPLKRILVLWSVSRKDKYVSNPCGRICRTKSYQVQLADWGRNAERIGNVFMFPRSTPEDKNSF